ncbi:MAG: RHS repeat protein [Xanthomonadales bacterium]|nr:RHS repeat protein [Xanthomonadales bacterium]
MVEQRYDSHGRLVKLLDRDRGVEDYAYNAAGELIRAVDGSNQEILQHFDALGRRWKRVSGSPQVTDVWRTTPPAGRRCVGVETAAAPMRRPGRGPTASMPTVVP